MMSLLLSSYSPLLAFGFVTPAFALAGGLLVAIPLAIHFLNRRRFKTVDWAAMKFLLNAMKQNRRRMRFESLLLLLARCAVVLLLGMALARPLGCDQSSIASLAAQRSGLHVIVIDNSYSMAYEADRPDAKTNLDQAKLIAKRLISRLNSGGDSVAIISAAKPASAVILAPTYDLEAARGAIDHIGQSFAGTDLPDALDIASKIGGDESRQGNRFLDIITDATRPAWEAPEQVQTLQAIGQALGKLYHITHYNVARPNEFNAAVTELRPASSLVRRGYSNDLIAQVHGYGGPTRTAAMQWRLDDQALNSMGNDNDAALTADSAAITQSRIQFTRGGPHVVTLAVNSDDRLKLDDVRQRVVNVAADLKVLVVEGERGAGVSVGGSGTFVMQALSPVVDEHASAEKRASYFAPELISDLELANKVLGEYRAIVLCGVAQINASQCDALRKFVEGGGTLMLFMGEPVSADNYNSVLLPRKLLPGTLVKRMTAAAGKDPFYFDFQPQGLLHPLLKKFRGVEKSGLDRAAIFTYWQLDVPRDGSVQRVLNFATSSSEPRAGRDSTTLASSETSDPAITLHDLGQGHVLFVATSAYIDWSSLPGKLNFAPLLHELLGGTVSAGDAWMNVAVGEPLRIPQSISTAANPMLKDAQQNEIVVEQTTNPDGSLADRSKPLSRPGVYTLSVASGSDIQRWPIAVNVPPEEADLRSVDTIGIRKALGDVEIDFQTDQLPSLESTALAANGRDFGWAFMVVLLVLAAVECTMAMRFGHYRQ